MATFSNAAWDKGRTNKLSAVDYCCGEIREIVNNETGGCLSTHGASGYTIGDAWNEDYTAIICCICGEVTTLPYATGQVWAQPKGFRAWLRWQAGKWYDVWPLWIKGEVDRRKKLGLPTDGD